MSGVHEPSSTDRERVTIDLTVVMDYCSSKRRNHQRAVRLFGLADDRTIELAVAPQGHRLDADGRLAAQIDQLIRDGTVIELSQLAYLSPATFTSPDLFLGTHEPRFREAWDHVALTWRDQDPKPPPAYKDWMHVETHVVHKRDVFITNDTRLLAMCRRLRDEHGFALEAIRLEDYMSARR